MMGSKLPFSTADGYYDLSSLSGLTCSQTLGTKPELTAKILCHNFVGELDPELPIGPPLLPLQLVQHPANKERVRTW